MKIRTKPIHLIRVKDDPFASTGTKDWNHVFPRKIKCSGFLTKLEERGGCSAFVGNYAEGSDTRSHAEGGKTWLSSWTRVRGAQFFQNFFIIWPQLRPPDLRSAWETQKKLEIFFKTQNCCLGEFSRWEHCNQYRRSKNFSLSSFYSLRSGNVAAL